MTNKDIKEEKVLKKIELHKKYIASNGKDGVKMDGVELRYAYLDGYYLKGCSAKIAKLNGVNLDGIDL